MQSWKVSTYLGIQLVKKKHLKFRNSLELDCFASTCSCPSDQNLMVDVRVRRWRLYNSTSPKLRLAVVGCCACASTCAERCGRVGFVPLGIERITYDLISRVVGLGHLGRASHGQNCSSSWSDDQNRWWCERPPIWLSYKGILWWLSILLHV
jgi:hypothetical protein